MKEEILKLVTRGDYYLKEAKSKYWVRQEEEQGSATCNCCKALKKYLKAYEYFLMPGAKSIRNFHVILRSIGEKDPDFRQFYDKIFEVKCFAEESKSEGERFFMYDDEMNTVIKITMGIRDYIAKKIHFEKQFLSEYLGTPFMAI